MLYPVLSVPTVDELKKTIRQFNKLGYYRWDKDREEEYLKIYVDDNTKYLGISPNKPVKCLWIFNSIDMISSYDNIDGNRLKFNIVNSIPHLFTFARRHNMI